MTFLKTLDFTVIFVPFIASCSDFLKIVVFFSITFSDFFSIHIDGFT